MVSDYTPPPVTQATLKGAPSVTVSPVGIAQGYPRNNNANYGPDTPGTTTCGINEAINSGAHNIELLSVSGYDFNTSTSILLPATYGIRFIGHVQPWNGPGQTNSCINYSGNGYAIDTQAGGSSNYNVHGWIDGICVISKNGGGVNLNRVIYSGGYLAAVGGGVAGMNGINFSAPSFGSESSWQQLRVGGYAGNQIFVNMDHFIVQHLTTAYTYAGQTVVNHANGIGFHIGYWHHYCSNAAPAYGLLIATGAAMEISVILWEASSYTLPANYMVSNSDTNALIIGTFGHYNGVTPTVSGNVVFVDELNQLISWGALTCSKYGNLPAVNNGLCPLRASSLRTALTATDASPITVYAVPATTGFFRISLTIFGRSGTITSGVATLKYTVGGVVITETVSITAVDTETHISPMVQPDASTDITVQLTTLTGTTPSVDVACVVEGVSSGT